MRTELNVTDTFPESDVCVIGGGMAGLCAALAAAREGAKTVLVHNRPVLGGNMSTEIRIPAYGAGHHNPSANETGIVLELLTEERARSHDAADTGTVNAQWDLILYDACRRQDNLSVLLNTLAIRANMNGNRIRSITAIQMGNEKVWEIPAKFFIDSSGDGVIGVSAGVPYRIGQEARSDYGEDLAPEEAWDWTLGSSLMFRARDVGRPVEFIPPPWAEVYPDEKSLFHRSHRRIESGYWWIEVGYPYDTIAQDEEIRDELLRHVMGVWDHIKNRCEHKDKAGNYTLDWVGMIPAKRESRRFIGAHVMTQQEIQSRELYPDRIAYGGWIIDDHTKGGILNREEGPNPHDHLGLEPYLIAPYSVTLRSLYSANVKNLFFGGRLISVSRLVFNSLRVQRTLAVIGQGGGTAAAHCAHEGLLPGDLDEIDIHTIQQSLLRQDCYIPHLRNEDPGDAARYATVTASSSRPLVAAAGDNGIALDTDLAQMLPLSAWPERVRIFVRNSDAKEHRLKGCLHRATDIWDLKALYQDNCPTINFVVPARSNGPVESKVQGGPCEPGLYWLRIGQAAANMAWLSQPATVPGMTSAKLSKGVWVFAPGCFSDWRPFAADVLPESRPFESENIVNGVARPETWPNCWLSEDGLPQWIRLDLAEPITLDRIQIAWGFNFNRTWTAAPPFHRAPECARDYRIEVVLADGSKALWADVRGNYHRLRIHENARGVRGKVKMIRITVDATNGAPYVELYEVRAYRA
ncbi:MAG: FAD-dependent oxidoreductase [Planctomycetota bacterium]